MTPVGDVWHFVSDERRSLCSLWMQLQASCCYITRQTLSLSLNCETPMSDVFCCCFLMFIHLSSATVQSVASGRQLSDSLLLLCRSPAAHAVASESSGEITATGRLQPGITGCRDGPAPQQGSSSLPDLTSTPHVMFCLVRLQSK